MKRTVKQIGSDREKYCGDFIFFPRVFNAERNYVWEKETCSFYQSCLRKRIILYYDICKSQRIKAGRKIKSVHRAICLFLLLAVYKCTMIWLFNGRYEREAMHRHHIWRIESVNRACQRHITPVLRAAVKREYTDEKGEASANYRGPAVRKTLFVFLRRIIIGRSIFSMHYLIGKSYKEFRKEFRQQRDGNSI